MRREIAYINDWSAVPAVRHRNAQKKERTYWKHQNPAFLALTSQYYFYAGYYESTKHRSLINPFCVRPSNPGNFHIEGKEIEGKAVLDLGCGPMSDSVSLVHCAKVHVLDPLADFYQQLQPFGWNSSPQCAAALARICPMTRRVLTMCIAVTCSIILRMATRS